ncbi:hypothetical protein ALMP_18680, partial [Streptomyces sp. A012304]
VDAPAQPVRLFPGLGGRAVGGARLPLPVAQLVVGLAGGLPRPGEALAALVVESRGRPGRRGRGGGAAQGRVRDLGEADGRGEGLDEAAGGPCAGGVLVGEDGVQGAFDLASGVLADRVAGRRRQLPGLPGERADQLPLPADEGAQLRPVEVVVGLAQRLAEPEQRLDLVGPFTDEEVAGPRRPAGAAQLADPVGERAVAGRAGGGHPGGAGGGELLRPQSVQLVGDSVQIHRGPSPPCGGLSALSPGMGCGARWTRRRSQEQVSDVSGVGVWIPEAPRPPKA